MLKDILERIDRRLLAVGLAESKAAKLAGLSDSAIRNMRRAVRNGKDQGASIKTIEAIAPILKTSSTWLLDGTGNEEGDYHRPSMLDIPLISWISAGELSHQDAAIHFDEFPTIQAINLPEGDWIALRVSGSSMNKISPPDSIILVNRADKRLVANGCYVIADEAGQATYKRYRPNEDPPFQPASYKDTPAPKLDGAIKIVGRVRRSIIDM
ncbi:LexA family protein [Pseudochrobactrum kiredjianiae]|uniref:LexA family protein n=1 Tax=Pseudochrobactrum kiredjianiae TaxID=386305 RepID=A0ABW3V2D1_9HYPH|nr:S24 family peptidase [Pseudochrobactrum kiredjianiae]MDM7851839.1 S24 family peptidase [Pseudochrobactrum kiredjianiae]